MRLPKEYSKYLGLGAEIAAALVIPIGIGFLADTFFDSLPYGVLIGAVVGIGIFFTLVFRIAKSFNKSKDHHLENND